jgi:hypothetical protein
VNSFSVVILCGALVVEGGEKKLPPRAFPALQDFLAGFLAGIGLYY